MIAMTNGVNKAADLHRGMVLVAMVLKLADPHRGMVLAMVMLAGLRHGVMAGAEAINRHHGAMVQAVDRHHGVTTAVALVMVKPVDPLHGVMKAMDHPHGMVALGMVKAVDHHHGIVAVDAIVAAAAAGVSAATGADPGPGGVATPVPGPGGAATPGPGGAATPGLTMEPPSTPVRPERRMTVRGAPDCLVCLQPVAHEAPIFLPCAHGPLHWTCFQRTMAATQNRCPLCRFMVPDHMLGPHGGGPGGGPGGGGGPGHDDGGRPGGPAEAGGAGSGCSSGSSCCPGR
eukprot:Skav229798  [mRNA]  locus=scaffold567:85961:87023:- [translate_table: standard]